MNNRNNVEKRMSVFTMKLYGEDNLVISTKLKM